MGDMVPSTVTVSSHRPSEAFQGSVCPKGLSCSLLAFIQHMPLLLSIVWREGE